MTKGESQVQPTETSFDAAQVDESDGGLSGRAKSAIAGLVILMYSVYGAFGFGIYWVMSLIEAAV
jgi:hypothetical protein